MLRSVSLTRMSANGPPLQTDTRTPVDTHVLGATLMPAFLMPWFFERIIPRLAADGATHLHPMSEWRGLGRTDRVVDSLRPPLEQARADRRKVRLVGHSLGGIVAWVLAHEYPDVVERAELWCAPIRGTALATVTAPVAESRFLAPVSRWLRTYDEPLNGPQVRAIYSPLDALAVPALDACYLEGDDVVNHVVSPLPLPIRRYRPNTVVHRSVGEHVFLPRHQKVNAALAREAA